MKEDSDYLAVSSKYPAYKDLDKLEEGYQSEIKSNPKYSLVVDPLNQYDFSDREKAFIENMIQYKNVSFVATVMMNMSLEEGIEIYKKYDVQSEIKRINLAMYARRFATKMADLDQLGGYLTSGLVDDNVAIADRWGPKEKLSAAKLLITLNVMRKDAFDSPDVVENIEIQKDLEKLTPNELKQIIEYNDGDQEEKEKIIDFLNEGDLLSMEELKNLRLMSLDELKDLAKQVKEGLEDLDDEETDE